MHFAALLVLHIYRGFLLFLCFDFVTDFSVFMFIYIYIYEICFVFSVIFLIFLSHVHEFLFFYIDFVALQQNINHCSLARRAVLEW